MSLQNPKLFGYELDAALLDVADKPLALRRLNLPPFDLEVIRGSANAGMISNDWRSFSRLSVPLIKTLDRFERETGRYMNLMDQRAGTNIILSGNLNVNGSISGKAIRYNYVKFNESNTANSEVKIADISTSRVSAWSSSDARATNTDLTIQANASISYGAQVGIATASGELVFGAQGSAKTVGGVTYNDSLGPRLQTTIVPEKKEFDSETPTHKIKVKLGDDFVWLYAMKGIPYTLKGIFRSFDATVNLTAQKPDSNGNPIPASWKVVETGNANKYVNFANKQSGLESKIDFSSPSVRERFIQFYYDPDYIETLTITSSFIEENPEIRLANALSFNLASNKITILPDFNFLTPILTSLILSSNELHKSEIQGEKFFNSAVVAKLPSTIVNLTMGNTFNGSIRGQTVGSDAADDGSGAGGNGDYSETGGTYTAKDLIVRRFPDLTTLNLNGGTRKFHEDNVDSAYIPNIPDTCTDYTIANNQFRVIGNSRTDNGSNTSHFPNGSFNIKEAPNLETLDVQNNHDLTDDSFQIGSSVIKSVNMHNTNLRLPDMKAKLFLTDFNATWCRNAYSLFQTQITSGASTDPNLKDVMSGYKFDICNELTELTLNHANLKNDRFPLFTNLKLTTLNLYETAIKGGAPGGNEDKVIPENTFANCPSLVDINITSDNLLSSEIAQYAFINCTELQSLCYNSKGSTSGNLPDFTANGQLRPL